MTYQFKNLFVLFIFLVSSTGFAQNLLSNGNFESGGNGVGFNINSCCYNQINPPFSGNTAPGNYAVTNNPQPMNTANFLSFGDHTTGTGNMLVVDGTNTGGQQRFWRAGNTGGGVCGLTVGTTYTFSFWIRSASSTVINQATQAQINIQWNNANNITRTSTNSTTGSGDILVPLPPTGWQQVVYTFVPTNACVNIEMYNNNTNVAGNDFAMDDVMVLAPPQPLSLTYSITNPTCPTNTNATLFGYGIGGTPPYTNYALSGPVNIPTSATGQFTGLAPGNYSITVTDSNGGTQTQNGIVIPNAPDMSLTATQTTICAGASTTITASGGMTTYNWSSDVPDSSMAATGSPQTVSPTQTTTYTVTSTSVRSENLIYNGDFFLGNAGFTSDYTYYPTNTSLVQKAYGVVSNSNSWETAFASCTEHTGSAGSKMLVVDGSTSNGGNDAFWCQTVPVTPGQNYSLTYYLQALATPANASIQIKINGVAVGGSSSTSATTCTWTQAPAINWNSGANTTANICFYDLTTSASGNDFAIDDITFSRTNNCNLSKSITITVTNSIVLNIVDPPAVCAPGTVNITAPSVIGAGSTAGTTFTYWTNAAGTNALPFATAQAITTSGTYYIKSTLGSCSVIKPVVVSIVNGSSVPQPTVTSPVRYCVGSVAVPLTATPAAGGTLNWYTAATGGSPLAGPPTPTTTANGITTYYVSQTIGGCESTRQDIMVYVGAQLSLVCDPSQRTTNPPTSVFFDWNNIPGPPVYNYSYSINGGPTITGSTNISSFEVFGVADGQSVTFTILSANGYPCINSVSSTCNNCATTTTPTFTLPSSICNGSTPPALPTTSNNGITGTWTPSVISNTTNGSYTFFPNSSSTCANSFVKTITISNPPNAGTLNGNQNICVGSTTPFSTSATGGTWSSDNTAIATVNASNGNVTGVSPGSATITYTVVGTGGCANATATRTITVTAAPNAGTLSGGQNICIGQTTSFTTTVSGGTWSSNNPAIATVSASGIITAVSAGTAAIVYTVAGSGGCSNATVSRNIIVSAPPTAGTLNGNQSICVGSTTTFNATVSGGTWSSATPTIATVNASTGVITGVSSGTTNIDYTVTGTGGCPSATVSRSVTVTSPIAAGNLSGNQNICVGNTTTFVPTVTGGTWSSSNTAFATVNSSGLITGIAAGSATITYTVTGSGGCPNATVTRTVSVAAVPSAGTLSGTQNVCIGFSTNFSSSVTGGTWSSSNPAIASVNALGVVIGVSAGNAVITYTVAGTNGCANGTATRNVTVSANPSPGLLTGTQTICQGQVTTFGSSVSGGTWSSSNPAIATIDANTGVIGGVTAGQVTMTYTVAGTGGCNNVTATRTLTVNPNITPTFNLITHVCQGETIPAFPTTSTNGITGTWDLPPNNMSTTTYTFNPTAGQCAVFAQHTITIDIPVTPLFDLVAPVCLGSTAPVLPTASNNTPPITGTWSPPTVSTATIGSTMYTFIPDPGQCVVTSSPTRLMVTVLPIVTPDFPALATICEGDTAPVLGNTSPNGISGTWSPATVSNTLDQNYTFTPNPGQCANTQTLSMTITRKINPDFAAIPAFCKDTPAPVLGLMSPNGVTGTWFPSVIDNTISGDFDYIFTPDATQCANPQSLTVTITEPTVPDFSDFGVCVGSTPPLLSPISANGITGSWNPPVVDNIVNGSYVFTPDIGQCATSRTINVTINQYTLTSIDGFVTNYFDENQIITILATSAGNYLYQLDYGPPQEENVFQNVSPGIHTIKVIDANGCSSSLTDQVLVVNYPKFFTPNDDNYNDTWNIDGLSDQDGCVISIFDRYGKLLKQISPKGTGWDGTYNGERMPSTDYWFTVEYNEKGTRKTFKSHFSLKR
ncbi:MAG: T9SS type B sorting domain-containing protein [Bacteroidetes bacterium]|nr:T9SS type B sorting domain-containing protein [Bacteroidota bacterium]